MNREQLNRKMANFEVQDLTIDGVDKLDFPDFCDAYFASGSVLVCGEYWRDLEDFELEWLSEDWGEKLSEMAHGRYVDYALSLAD